MIHFLKLDSVLCDVFLWLTLRVTCRALCIALLNGRFHGKVNPLVV